MIPAVPPGAVPHPGVPGLACGEPQRMGGIEGTGGCSRLLLFSTIFQCNLKAEHLQGEMASAPAGFTLHPRSWPAAGRAACSCLYGCPGTCWSTSETEWVLLGRAGLSQPRIQSGASPLPGFCMCGWEGAGRGLAGFHGSGECVGQEETGCLGSLGQIASPLQFWLRKGRLGAKARHRWTSEEVCERQPRERKS